MGYTHYWKQADIPADQWAGLTRDAAAVIARHAELNPDRPLSGPRGQGVPELSAARIAINGRDADDGWEPFIVTPAAGWNFCKTQWRPYDVVVCAILLRATLTVPDFLIDSDGEWEADWAHARDLYTSVFGEDPGPEPFRDTDDDEDLADED
jgi:hypothetical protein